MNTRRRRWCEQPGEDHLHDEFTYMVERDGLMLRVCQQHLRRGDKVFYGRKADEYTVWTYQTGN